MATFSSPPILPIPHFSYPPTATSAEWGADFMARVYVHIECKYEERKSFWRTRETSTSLYSSATRV